MWAILIYNFYFQLGKDHLSSQNSVLKASITKQDLAPEETTERKAKELPIKTTEENEHIDTDDKEAPKEEEPSENDIYTSDEEVEDVIEKKNKIPLMLDLDNIAEVSQHFHFIILLKC